MNATAFASLYASTLPPTAVVSVTTAAVSRSATSASRHAETPSIVTAITLPRILYWIRMFSLRMIWPPDSVLVSGRRGLLQEPWKCSWKRAEALRARSTPDVFRPSGASYHERKDASLPGLALDGERPHVRLDDATRDRQPQAGTPAPIATRLPEPLEEMRELFGWN